MPEEDNISGAFTECQLTTLKGLPTYEYMPNLNDNLNPCSSEVNFMQGCGTLVYLVLRSQPNPFNTHCGTALCVPKNTDIHPVMPEPTPTAAILSELFRTHKHEVRLVKKYYAVDRAYKKVTRKLIHEKYYKSLSRRIIGFSV